MKTIELSDEVYKQFLDSLTGKLFDTTINFDGIDVDKIFTPRAKQLIKLAVEEAKLQNHTYVGIKHFEVAMGKMDKICKPWL